MAHGPNGATWSMRLSKSRWNRTAGSANARRYGQGLHPDPIRVKLLLTLLFAGLLVLLPACASAGQSGSATTPGPTFPSPEIPAPNRTPETSPTSTPPPGATATFQVSGPSGTPITIQSTIAGNSGIEGQALIGPACPGPARLEQPCPDKPYHGIFSVLDPEKNEVARFQTDLDGKYRLPLLPGTYTVHAVMTAAYPRVGDQVVTVSAGQFTTLNILFDSGMR